MTVLPEQLKCGENVTWWSDRDNREDPIRHSEEQGKGTRRAKAGVHRRMEGPGPRD